ncbi:MAG: polysaccharide deacetylase family protein [Ferruginibacter sp.]
MKQNHKILLTFDVEEFDLPLEYELPIEQEEQFQVGKRGLDIVENILSNAAVETTLFTTANFASQFPEDINRLAQNHEIASHSFYHTGFKKEDLLNSRIKLEEISGKSVEGLRMPRFREVEVEWVREAGYHYDSSINPTFIPGRYNHRNLPRTIYKDQEMLRVPCSVTPNLRLPLFWLSFKNMSYPIYKRLALQTLRRDGYLSLYFHPWEFTDLSTYALPGYVKRKDSIVLQERLIQLINDLKSVADFCSISTFLKDRK